MRINLCLPQNRPWIDTAFLQHALHNASALRRQTDGFEEIQLHPFRIPGLAVIIKKLSVTAILKGTFWGQTGTVG